MDATTGVPTSVEIAVTMEAFSAAILIEATSVATSAAPVIASLGTFRIVPDLPSASIQKNTVAAATPPTNTVLITLPTSSYEFSSDKGFNHEETSGSSGGAYDERLHIEGLYLPTITWDPHMPDKPYKPRWKIVGSTRLIYPQVVNHWVDHGFPPRRYLMLKARTPGRC
ncbi:hypothetical protein Hanom_Chr11g01061511 [Helianthus anomalus]